MLQTTVSKKTNRRNRSQEKNKRSQKEKEKSRKNIPQPTKQRIHLRNEFEFPSKRFLGEYSNKGISAQDLRSNIDPIYQMPWNVSGFCPQTLAFVQIGLEIGAFGT